MDAALDALGAFKAEKFRSASTKPTMISVEIEAVVKPASPAQSQRGGLSTAKVSARLCSNGTFGIQPSSAFARALLPFQTLPLTLLPTTFGGNLLREAIDYFCHLAVAPGLVRSPGLNSTCRNAIRSPPRQRLAQPAPPR